MNIFITSLTQAPEAIIQPHSKSSWFNVTHCQRMNGDLCPLPTEEDIDLPVVFGTTGFYFLLLCNMLSELPRWALHASPIMSTNFGGDAGKCSGSVFTASRWPAAEMKAREITWGFRGKLIRWPFSWGLTNLLIAGFVFPLTTQHGWFWLDCFH